MLPSLKNAKLFEALIKTCGFTMDMPETLFDHWQLFKGIANTLSEPWYSEVLIFTKKWFEPLDLDYIERKDIDSSWHIFYLTLNDKMLTNRLITDCELPEIRYSIFDDIYKVLIELENKKKVNYGFYYKDTIEALLKLSKGAAVGFMPADNSQIMLPTKIIEQAYLNAYTKREAPIIFCPGKLGKHNIQAVYFSFYHPLFTLGEVRSYLGELKNTKVLIDTLRNSSDVLSKIPKINDIFFKKYNYDFFYIDDLETNRIKHSSRIPDIDSTLAKDMKKRWLNLTFPYHSPFTRACVRIEKL